MQRPSYVMKYNSNLRGQVDEIIYTFQFACISDVPIQAVAEVLNDKNASNRFAASCVVYSSIGRTDMLITTEAKQAIVIISFNLRDVSYATEV